MNGALFALVSKERDEVFAWGMEITVQDDPETDEPVTSTLVYRPAIDGERSLISVHDTAEAALAAYRRILPVELEWDADLWYEAFTTSLRTAV